MPTSQLQRNWFVFLLAMSALPMAASCSRHQADNDSKQGEPDKSAPVDLEANRLDNVIAEATEAIKKKPQEFDSRGELAFHRRAKAFAEKGNNDQAITDFTEAIRLYPLAKPPYQRARLVEAHNARAKCFENSKEHDKAIGDYTTVIDLAGGGFSDLGEALVYAGIAANARYKRGVLYDGKGENEKAIADYKEAVRLAPELLKTNPDLKRRLGD